MSVQHETPAADPAGRVPGERHATGYDAATRERLAADAAQIMARYPQERSALLPMLHLVQAEDGYVSPRGIAFCAAQLGLTTAEVSAVATFYTQYKRHPNGTYTVGVCTNTLCAVMGGDAIWEELTEHLGVDHDETTEDGAITLERIECNAACDYAPVVMVNWEFFDDQTPESARDVVDRLREGVPVAPTRGAASVCTFRQMSRVLAGFPDGRADEGVGAGPATLRGTLLAKEKGWRAPDFPDVQHVEGQVSPSGGAPAGQAQPEDAKPAATGAGPTPAGQQPGADPKVGAEESSAQRPATTPADSSPEGQQRRQRTDDAKES
ncbi:NADH-quinone oxidoreductase subunit NuoE [Cellulomonas sp. 179-A 9B4 NHS]|uniref:NADH-quinone oxidoreductase subunit NuoE n=1 Tax=Cellulomonas sp. 179-A 9B4 NHS TaxID=3142379 RepID=UPI0039A08617